MPKKLAKKKVKPKPKQKQKQKQKQSQRTSVTVNINTKSKTKRKAPRATNGNTNRVLQQFAQPLITLPSNLINPPIIPQSGLIPSPLQTRRNDGEAVSMGQRLGSDSAMREQMRVGIDARPNDEQSLSGFSFDSRADTLRNYQEPSITSGITPSLGSSFTFSSSIPSQFSQGSNAALSNFTVDTSDKSSSVAPPPPIKIPQVADFVRNAVTNFNIPRRFQESRRSNPNPQIAEGRGNLTNIYATTRTPFRGSVGGLTAETPQPVGVPMPDNTPLRPPDDRYTDRLIRDDTY
tara:strand:- start:78 stop:950 length:873 start_codon:yes stop_codon:yes gene_type:complete